jgi:hypothetical protein
VGRRKLSAEIRGGEIEVERGHTSVGAESKVPSPSKWHRPIIRAFAVAVSGVGRSPDAPKGPQDAVAATEADPGPIPLRGTALRHRKSDNALLADAAKWIACKHVADDCLVTAQDHQRSGLASEYRGG